MFNLNTNGENKALGTTRRWRPLPQRHQHTTFEGIKSAAESGGRAPPSNQGN